MRYFLMESEKQNRLMIGDDFPHTEKGLRVLEDIDAHCWLDAKKRLGFELTGLQELLLQKQLDALVTMPLAA